MTAGMGRVLPILVLIAAIAVAILLVLTGSAKPEYLLTILGIVSGASIVTFQLGEQQRTSLALQRENARQALKLKVYEQLLKRVEAVSETSSRSRGYVYSISSSIDLYLQGIRWSNTATISGLKKKSSRAADALGELIEQLERWEISFASADLFRWAFGTVSHEIGNSFSDFFKVALTLLPSDALAPSPQPSISAERLGTIKERADLYVQACNDLHSYLQDLVVEAQNELLSNLFDRRVKARNPLDPKYKVITESRREELLLHFGEETALGKSMNAARSRVRERLKAADA